MKDPAALIITLALVMAYVGPAFVMMLIVVAIYSAATKRIRGFRQILKEAAVLTVPATFALFIVPPVLLGFMAPHAPPLDKVSVETFSFNDYAKDRLAIGDALKKLFPAGTTKTYVDSILVTKMGAIGTSDENVSKQLKEHAEATVAYSLRTWPWTCYPMGGTPKMMVVATFDPALKLISWSTFSATRNTCNYF